MHPAAIQLENVTYNAAERAFEALARIKDQAGERRIPCRFEAALSAQFEQASNGLVLDAQRQIARTPDISSRIVEKPSLLDHIFDLPTPGWFDRVFKKAA